MLINDCFTTPKYNKRPFTSQVENKYFTKHAFTSFGKALDHYLTEKYGRGANKMIAERLVKHFDDSRKVSSWKVQIGQWRNGKRDTRPHNIEKVNEVLNVRIEKDEKDNWFILEGKHKVLNKIDDLEQTLDDNDISNKELDQILLSLRGRALSLSKDLSRFADEIQKIRSVDD
jgi:hypothetical protein